MEKYHEIWLEEERKSIEGWDFSVLDGRWESEAIPWDYQAEIQKRLKPTDRLLDLGTGGGEFLLTLNHPYELTCVTEGYPPNLEICKNKLEPLGITVKGVDESNHLDYPDAFFDLVIDRHEAYDLSEVKRVLKPGGVFITQQVGGRNNEELSRWFIPDFVSEYADFDGQSQKTVFIETGFRIEMYQEASLRLKFFDVGTVVFYAKNIPWEFPGFTVDVYLPRLDALQALMDEQGYIQSMEYRFIIVARKV
ncbi:MAG TPA: SAM-dependent methyltransferase [Erysipelotrichaceae bacterium]|nr:SAM-dependent methyltransferase [Erysipelotrichaceae bacterium]